MSPENIERAKELRSEILEKFKFLENLPPENINGIVFNLIHSEPENPKCSISGVVGGDPQFIIHAITETISNLFELEPTTLIPIMAHITGLIKQQVEGTGAAPQNEELNQKLSEIFSQTRH